jgi:hypothetical protein
MAIQGIVKDKARYPNVTLDTSKMANKWQTQFCLLGLEAMTIACEASLEATWLGLHRVGIEPTTQ